ncbi:competence type IV pilus major pilin ComGC [Defluviitalea saccharophila]|uniref:Prepilin-type N-terminal cleavage/methylation domain-containing protein n=1 Tax=Defluviitalea saccharophila TaxID=879970 RepID=A0ABZ2Y8Z4_9FIRM
MLRKLFKEEKGFTMIELIIVIAIIAIIGAIIAPSFTKATTKSKIKADVASIREVNRQIALYMAEKGEYPADLAALKTAGYLEEEPSPQTAGIKFVYSNTDGKVVIEADSPNKDVKDAVNGLSDDEKKFVTLDGFK